VLTGTTHYLLQAASHASVPSLATSKQSTSLTLSYAMFTSYTQTQFKRNCHQKETKGYQHSRLWSLTLPAALFTSQLCWPNFCSTGLKAQER